LLRDGVWTRRRSSLGVESRRNAAKQKDGQSAGGGSNTVRNEMAPVHVEIVGGLEAMTN
jgi:hypothetical protein